MEVINSLNIIEPTTEELLINKEIVKRVIDGDTIELSSGERVRYIGIDTPERGECFYEQAKKENEKLVLNKQVKLVKDVSQTDKYGRLLRYVYVKDLFVNLYLIKNGYAVLATYPPDVSHQQQFLKAQKHARIKKLGLWSKNTCNKNIN